MSNDKHSNPDQWVPIAKAHVLRQPERSRRESRDGKLQWLGHGITKPKSVRGVMQHNFGWFHYYIWGDPLPDSTALEPPKNECKDEKKAEEI